MPHKLETLVLNRWKKFPMVMLLAQRKLSSILLRRCKCFGCSWLTLLASWWCGWRFGSYLSLLRKEVKLRTKARASSSGFLFVLQAGRSGQPNDCSFLKLGNLGERMIVRSTSLKARLVAPGQTGRFLRLFAPRCCPAAWKLLHAHPASPVSEQLFGI